MANGEKTSKGLRDIFQLKATLAEFMGVFFFLFIAVTAVSGWGAPTLAPIGIAAVFGITIFCLEIGFGETSGGHFNPAVSLGVFLTGGMGVVQLIAYWLAQFAGAIAGACFARLVVGDPMYANNQRAVLQVGTKHSTGRAFLGEAIATCFLMVVVLQVSPDPRNKKNKQSKAWAPLAIGFTVLVCHLALVPIDGCSINPARALGTAVAGWSAIPHKAWTGQWVFIVGPFVGALVAGLVKKFVLPQGDKMLGINEEAAGEDGKEEV